MTERWAGGDWPLLVVFLGAAPTFILGLLWEHPRRWWIAESVVTGLTLVILGCCAWLGHGQRTILWAQLSVFYLGPVTFTLPWMRLLAKHRLRLLPLVVAPVAYVVGVLLWLTLAVNMGALLP